MRNPSGAEEIVMGEAGVGVNIAGGNVGVELGGIGLGVKVAVGLIVVTGGVTPQATSITASMIAGMILRVCFIATPLLTRWLIMENNVFINK
jgi:hypothetical protein